MIPCPPLERPEVTREVWDSLSPSEQAAYEDGISLSWAADYETCQARHQALINHRKELDN